ncbi:uncharacterized protein LOC135948154 isoform X1 [Cloeon dipterum]|uniref:uncharacterized protein LOC135948154 isoform X1 n=1 Tax=Cloeon dipterum TaxID=197152 RepID=UPI00322060E1
MLEHRQQQNPPFLVGERAVWLGSGSGLPQGGHVRWIGKLPGMGSGWSVGLELDKELPYGGIDGSWCGRQLFQCRTKHGLLVPASVVAKEDSLLRSFGVAPVINKAQQSPRLDTRSSALPGEASPRATKAPVPKPKRTKSSASSSRASSQQSVVSRSRRAPTSPDPSSSADDTLSRPVVKPVRRNSKKAREQAEFAKLIGQQAQRPTPRVAKDALQRVDSQGEEVRHAFQPLPKSAFAPPLDSLPIDDSVLKLLASRLPQLSGVSILSEPQAPKKTPRRSVDETTKVDLSVLPASAIRVPKEFSRQIQQSEKAPAQKQPERTEEEPAKVEVKPVKAEVESEKAQEEPLKVEEVEIREEVLEKEEEKPDLPQVLEIAHEIPKEESKESVVEAENKNPDAGSESEVEVFEDAATTEEPEREAETAASVEPIEEEEEEEEEEKDSCSSPAPPPPPKSKKDGNAGHFHTAPARPNRHRSSVKKRAPLPPINSGVEKEEEESSKAEVSAENNQHSAAADTSTPPRVPLRRHNSLNGPRRPLSDVAPAQTTEELIYQWFDAIGDAPAAPPRHHARPDSMNSSQPQTKGSPSISPSISITSFEDAVAAADAIYSERYDKQFANLDSGSSVASSTSSSTATFTSNTNHSSHSNRRSGGILSFLKWLRKTDSGSPNSGSEEQQQVISKEAPLSRSSSTNSLGTVVSAASSFAFVKPAAYHNNNNKASLHYAPPAADSDTYRLRIRQRERSRILDKGLTFKRKYKLRHFACSQETVFSDTLKPIARGKRKAPAPPVPKSEHYSELSLPINLEHRKRMEIMEPNVQVKLHRRSASESAKDKRAGAYLHVRGKRKAPQPPSRQQQVLRPVTNFPSLGRNKKRQAPTPPPLEENMARLSPDEKQRLIDCINRAKNSSPTSNLQGPALITAPPIILAAPEMPPQSPTPSSANLSPKPWYKRPPKFSPMKLGNKKPEETEMPEVNYARVLPDPSKRKSMQFQALTKFSDIDKEAAALIQNNQQKAAELLAARNNSYYMPIEGTAKSENETVKVEKTPDTPIETLIEEPKAEEEAAAKAPPTKGLISKFNAISNISKVTVNSSKAALVGLLINNESKNQNGKKTPPVRVVQEEKKEEAAACEAKNKSEVEEKKKPDETKHEETPAVKIATDSLYPKLTALETPQPEPEEKKETPLPLSIHGAPEGMTLNRQKKKMWICPRCTLENENWRFTCDACNMWRPSKGPDEASLPAAEAAGVNTVEEASNSIQKMANDVTKEEEAFKKPEPIGPIDWEVELKHYFPEKKSPERKRESPPKMNAKVAEAIKILEGKKSPPPGPVYVKTPEKKAEVQKPTPVYAVSMKNSKPFVMEEGRKQPVEVKDQAEEKKTPMAVAETFIGGRTEADEKKTKPQTASSSQQTTKPLEGGKVVGSNEPTTPKDVDEVRKARLAFFNKEEKAVEAKPPASPRLSRAAKTPAQAVAIADTPPSPKVSRTVEISTDTTGLVVTLKEKGAAVVAAANAADLEEKLRIKEKLKEMKNSLPKEPTTAPMKATEPFSNKGAIKKSPPAQEKRQAPVLKPNKVSSAAQTSGAIVKTSVKDQTTRAPANGSPVVVKKIIARSPSFKGNGTFLLMGPKDFASIEATKSNKTLAPPETQHVYANIPSPGLVPSGNPAIKNAPPKPEVMSPEPAASVLTPPPPAQKVPSPILKNRPGIKPVMVKVELNAQVEDDYGDDDDEDEDEYDNLDDQSSLSGAADSGSAAGSVGDSSDIEKLAGTLTQPKGIAEFKADLATSPPQRAQNTLAVNRLLRRLENAIANGQHRTAAGLARDLARLKINCKVERQRIKTKEPEMFTVDMYVEDKVSHQGPIPLSVYASMTVGELKAKVQQEFEIPADVQRWILGKKLASDDNKTLQQHSVASGGCVVFLYLVAPPERNDSASPATNRDSPAVVATPPPPPAEDRILPPAPENQRGPGWYYNFEEDRYSYCESSEESDPEEEPKNVQPLPPEPAPRKERTPPIPAPRQLTPPLAEPEEDLLEDGNVAAAQPEASFEPTAPPASLEKKPAVVQIGWTCPLCTLINPPTRPGCAACTTDRPADYKIPDENEISDQEAKRLQQEEENDQALENQATQENGANNYEALVALENMDLVPNMEPFDCPVCFGSFPAGEGAMLRECLHTFCRPCLAHTAQFSEDVEVRCPFRNDQYTCDATLQEREVRALVTPDVYDKLQAKSVAQAENKIKNAFHCKTPDCRGWCIFEDNVNDFRCPVCGHHNCLTCQAIHDGINCKQYQERVTQASETDAEAMRTKAMLQEMVERGEALCCPTCKVVLMKKWGCDWLRCSMCKTEICWVTRGPRWGAAGKGDLSGGCKCGVNGVKCHPKCNYCH